MIRLRHALAAIVGRFAGRNLVLATAGTLATRAVALVCQIAIFVIAARMLPIADVGVFAIANTLWTLNRALGPLGFDQLAIRIVPRLARRDRDGTAEAVDRFARLAVTGASLAFGAGLCGSLVLFGRGAFGAPGIALLIAAGLPAYALIGLQAGQIRARDRLAASLMPEMFTLQPGALAIVLSLWLGRELSLETLLASQVALAWLAASIYRLLRPRGVAAAALKRAERVIYAKMAGRLFLANLATALHARLPNILVALLLGAAPAALIDAGQRLAFFPQQVTWAVGVATMPRLARAISDRNGAALERLYAAGSRVAFWPAALFTIAVVLVGRIVLTRLLGPQFEPAWRPAIILCAAAAINARYAMASYTMLVAPGETLVLAFTTAGIVAMLAAILALAPAFGIVGAAAAAVLGFVVRDFGLHKYIQLERPRRAALGAAMSVELRV